MFALVLSSCAKEVITPKSDMSENLTGKAKSAHDMVWGKTSISGNYIQFKNPFTFLNTTNGELETFKVASAKPYTTTDVDPISGTGVIYSGEGYRVKVIDSPEYPTFLFIECYKGEVELMTRMFPRE